MNGVAIYRPLLWLRKERTTTFRHSKMHLRLQLRFPLLVLTIVDLSLSIPNTQNQSSNRAMNAIDASNDGSHKFSGDVDKHESNAFHRNNIQSSDESSSFGVGADNNNRPLYFLITNFLSDGEIERRIHFDGITAKQTRVADSG